MTMEDDDDEGFGDFTFAPVTVHSNPGINGLDHRRLHDDDDWGDFVKSTALLRSESLPVKSFNSLNFVSDHRTDNLQNNDLLPDTAPSLVQTQWVKPKGALPLSLFGEVEKREEEDGSGAAGLLFYGGIELKTNKDVKEEKKMGSELNVNELISNLYKRSEQSNGVNGSKLDTNGSGLNLENLTSYGLHLDSNGLDLKRSSSNLNSNGLDLKRSSSDLDSNGLDSKISAWNSDSNGLNLRTNLDSSGLSSELDEDDEWDFKGAESKLPAGDFNVKSHDQAIAANVSIPNLNGLNTSWNMLGSDLNGLSSNFSGVNLDSNGFSSSLVDKSEDFGDDDEWEFKDAESEAQSGDSNHRVDSKGLENSEGVKHTIVFDNGAHVPTDLFAVPDGVSQKSGELDFGFDFSKSLATLDGISNSFSNSKLKNDNGNENGLDATPVNWSVDNGENSWAFKDAFSGAGSKDKGNEAKLQNHKGALPVSIFGDGELETDEPSIHQDVPTYNLASSRKDEIKKSLGSNISINDLISSLYSQAEQTTSVNHTQNPTENGLVSVQKVADSSLVDGDADFDDDSWEFKGAISKTVDEDQSLVLALGDSHMQYSSKVEQEGCADFYSKLEDELLFVTQCHLDNLKKARSTAALCGEDTELKALDTEIQDFYNELQQDGIVFNRKEANPQSRSMSNICLNDFVEVLQQPKFHVLESEYQLLRRLSLAEKDWRSAIELLKHAASTSKILKLGSREEQSYYVSTWFKMVSVCAQELRHGATIWNQSVEKNVFSQILSDPRGKRYILALGEIYRAIQVLGSSIKLYKPLVLLSSANPVGMFALLTECSSIWSSLGLEEALRNISDLTGFEYNVTPKELLQSIKYIHDLDAPALYNHVFSRREPTCRLSLLTAGAVPDMKMVVWGGEHYFLPLANLWANLVTSDPPNLPRLHGG